VTEQNQQPGSLAQEPAFLYERECHLNSID